MDVWLFLCLSIVTGICVTTYSHATDSSKYNDIELRLCYSEFITLYFIRTLHIALIAFLALYPFVSDFSVRNDLAIIGFITLLFLHWRVLNGWCCLNLMEKSILFPDGVNAPTRMTALGLLNVPGAISDQPNNIVWVLASILGGRILYTMRNSSVLLS